MRERCALFRQNTAHEGDYFVTVPKLGIEATKESTKFRDWEDGGGWRTWRGLRAEEEKKQEEKRKEARGG